MNESLEVRFMTSSEPGTETHLSPVLVAFLISVGAVAAGCAQESVPAEAAVVDEPIRTIRLPTVVWESGAPRDRLDQSPESLVLAPGAEDELPRGPQGFDVLHDGGFVVADPLRDRLAFYDSAGAYGGDLALGMAVMSVTVLDDGQLEVREALTGDYFVVDELGRAQRIPETVRAARATTQQGEAVLDRQTGAGGQLTWTNTRGEPAGTLQVTLDREDRRMVSLRGLRTADRGNAYVSIEATRGGEVIDVEKIVRAYDDQGNPVLEIRDIPLDYYVHPVNELRVRDGRVYQLFTTEEQVLIHVWQGP
jgi:hypothetical protein